MNLKVILFNKMPHSAQYRIPHSGPYTTPRSRAWSKRPPTMAGEEGRDRGAWAGASLSPIIAGFSVSSANHLVLLLAAASPAKWEEIPNTRLVSFLLYFVVTDLFNYLLVLFCPPVLLSFH